MSCPARSVAGHAERAGGDEGAGAGADPDLGCRPGMRGRPGRGPSARTRPGTLSSSRPWCRARRRPALRAGRARLWPRVEPAGESLRHHVCFFLSGHASLSIPYGVYGEVIPAKGTSGQDRSPERRAAAPCVRAVVARAEPRLVISPSSGPARREPGGSTGRPCQAANSFGAGGTFLTSTPGSGSNPRRW